MNEHWSTDGRGDFSVFDTAFDIGMGGLTRLLYPIPEDVNIVLIDEGLVSEAEQRISGCENCSKDAELTFDYVLDALTASDPIGTEYLLRRPAKCPRCRADVTEKTVVVFE